MKKTACVLAMMLIVYTGFAHAVTITITDSESNIVTNTVTVVNTETDAREVFIDDIINTAQTLYEESNGKWMSAYYKSDIYVCKNFTVYIYKQNASRFRMEEYPVTKLVIPNNIPAEKDGSYYKGVGWEEISASEGNPFYEVAKFRYSNDLTLEENKEIAREFMMQSMRGDFFQMNDYYEYGEGPHSLVMIENYNPEFQTVCWTDSNMITKKVNGISYGKVQFGRVESIDFFVDAFCHPKRGATLYRLRDDIIFADGEE